MFSGTQFDTRIRRALVVALGALFLIIAAGRAHAFTISAFGPVDWKTTDVALGISGFNVEDFEDTVLVAGLQVQLTDSTNSYGPTSTLPKTFDPSSDDPNPGKVFLPGIWDGSHLLLNRNSNPPSTYLDFEWGDITFHVPAGTRSLGFSLQNMELTAPLSINGSFQINLNSVPLITTGSGPNGYIRIDADPLETIYSVTIQNSVTGGTGDGLAFDHVAFSLVPVPGAVWLLGSGLIGIAGFRRKTAKK